LHLKSGIASFLALPGSFIPLTLKVRQLSSVFPSAARVTLSLKLYLAAMISLSIAFWQDFDYPYWTMMVIYILALDSSGAMRQKWSYMLNGSVVGGAFGVLASFLFATSQITILISLISMLAMAAFFASRDRLPSFYGFMIGGVTCLLVALPGITTPDGALLRAIHRIQDIAVGAAVLFLVDTLIFPTAGTIGLRKVIDAWLEHLRSLCVSALRGEPLDDKRLSAWLGQTAQIDPLASYLSFETISHGAQRRRSADTIRTLGLRLLPLLDVLRDDARTGRDGAREGMHQAVNEGEHDGPAGGVPVASDPTMSRAAAQNDVHDELREPLARWIEQGAPEDRQRDLHRALRVPPVALQHVTEPGGDPRSFDNADRWRHMRAASQRRCLRAVFSAWCLIGSAQRNMTSRRPVSTSLPTGSRPTPTAIAQVDIGYTLRIVLALVVHLTFFCFLWSTFKWISGYAALGGLLSSVFLIASCRSNTPVPVLLKIARIVGIALGIVALYVTLVLPHTSSMATVALVLFPALFVLGTVVPDPGNVLFAVLPMALLRLGNNGPSVDFPTLLNSVAGLGLGICSALLAIMLFVRLPAGGILRRLQRENRHDLYDVLRGEETDGKAYGWRALDRFMLIFQQAPQKDAKQKNAVVSRAMREWRLGVDIAELHHRSPSSASMLPEALHRALMQRFHAALAIDAVHTQADSERLLGTIDTTIMSDAATHWPARARAALVDIRTALFPGAPAPAEGSADGSAEGPTEGPTDSPVPPGGSADSAASDTPREPQ